MSYNRSPNVVIAGAGLKQTPAPNVTSPPGIVPVTLEAKIATTSDLGVISVGSGLHVSSNGVLSTTTNSIVDVILVSSNYTVDVTDYFIVVTKKETQITLPFGITGKVYIIKNKANGNITVKGTSGQTIDSSATKSLGSEASLYVIYDGARWNIIT
jgi:hypothetical protein